MIERLCRAATSEAAQAYLSAVGEAVPSAQWVTQDDWGKTYEDGYCFNMRFSSQEGAQVADELAPQHGVSFVDPDTIVTRDNWWA